MKFRTRNGRAFGFGKLVVALPALLLNACLGAPPGDVENHWGQAYEKTMQAQIPDAPLDSEKRPSYATDLGGVDALTSELILENYQVDVKRAPANERDTFIIDTGLK